MHPAVPKAPKSEPKSPAAATTPRESAPNEKPVRTAESRRRALDVEPVRAVEPHEPIIRQTPAHSRKGPRAFQPTFDLSESTWATAATIRSLENRWQTAIKNHDVATVDALLADDLEATSLTGAKGGKATLLSALRNDKNVYKSVKARGMSVSNAGPGRAIVTGITTETGTTADGTPFKTSRRFTDTWEQRKGRWECVASTATPLPTQ